eukprot:CAMPEP_0179190158 /NCGR_PEP_ID=MMETSP0796-20121207/94412_1 /TAXON_ID=73915 /ORGANISM="Pyrodinium bahamense, Strain pbaha01" /LENGTH=81 /DNA_ID=CAMNT_0020894313 /DNA_START=344 /DNA_END=586 /DNA_ORIENTATION=-
MTTRPAFLSKPPGKKAALRPPLLPRRVTTPHAKATATKSLNAIQCSQPAGRGACSRAARRSRRGPAAMATCEGSSRREPGG